MVGNGEGRQRKHGLCVLPLLLAVAIFSSASPVMAAPSCQSPFPEGAQEYVYSTGHYIKGPFLDFFRTRGGVRIFGYPQTEVFYDAHLGLWVQYFDNVRMEWHPENPDPYKVQLGLLADLLGHRYPPIPADQAPRNDRFHRYYPETGHTVSFAFLVFYDQNGGLDNFGYPISEPMLENGRIVQYFQRARMEWHPERPRDERVVLGSLGLAYMQRFGVPEEYRARQSPPGRPSQTAQTTAVAGEAAGFRVWAFVRYAITGREGYQTVYIYVTDAGHRPISGASGRVMVHFPSETVEFTVGPTDSRGISSVTFPIHSLPPGQRVVIDVTAQYGEQSQRAQTFFVPWY